MAAAVKASGNAKFQVKDYNGAQADYTAGIEACSEGDTSLLLTLYSNRAACRLALGNDEGAAADARRATEIDSTHTKSYFRLAKATKDIEEAGRAALIAVALSKGNVESALELVYQDARLALASRNSPLWMPESTALVCLVSPGHHSVARAFQHGHDAVCALPGQYTEAIWLDRESAVLVGIGDVTFDQSTFLCMNTLVVKCCQTAYIYGITFIGGTAGRSHAAIAICNGHKSAVTQCRFHSYSGAGILVTGEDTKTRIVDCSFRHLPNMAIEVREGGSLVADNIDILRCKQGLVAYGGAQGVEVSNSSIVGCSKEGLLYSGNFHNAATVMQQHVGNPETGAQLVSEAADAWGRARGIQFCGSVSSSTVRDCGNFGLSIDYGAQVAVFGCFFKHNDPNSIFIKGGSDLSLAACHLEFSNTKSKSPFVKAARASLPPGVPKAIRSAFDRTIKQSAITIGTNYNGIINLSTFVTIGHDSEQAIVDECQVAKSIGGVLPEMTGSYTKPPAISHHNHFQVDSPGIPSVEVLCKQLPPSWKSIMNNRSSTRQRGVPSSLLAMRKPCREHQDASWSPTGHQYYAIGNSFGYNITSSSLPPPGKDIRVMFGACGDIRNLLSTLSTFTNGGKVSFVMNDGNIAMLARNAVILQMIAFKAPSEHILAVWANHALTIKEHESLMKAINQLAESSWPDWLNASSSLDPSKHSSRVENDIRSVLQSWSSCNLTVDSILSQRSSILNAKSSNAYSISLNRNKEAIGPSAFSKFGNDIVAYIDRGSLMAKGVKAALLLKLNVTLLLPELQYTVYHTSSIFRAVSIGTANAESAYLALVMVLRPQFQKASEQLSSGICTISMVPSDILVALCEPSDVKFDYIDCTNVADYISLPAVLHAAKPRLCQSSHARLFLESMVMFKPDEYATIVSFVESVLGYSINTLKNLVGLQLLEGTCPPIGPHGIRMEFANICEAQEVDWVSTIKELTKPASLEVYGSVLVFNPSLPAACSSPGTLVHLILSYTAPEIAEIIIPALVRCGRSKFQYYEWEIDTQMRLQLGDKDGSFKCIKYTGKPSIVMGISTNSMLLTALSKSRLEPGSLVSLEELEQVFSCFSWDAEMCISYFLLRTSYVSTAKELGLYVTVLLSGPTGLRAATESERFNSLKMETIEPPLPKWNDSATPSQNVPTDLKDRIDRLDSCKYCRFVANCSKCSRCHSAVYCSKNCQVQDWKKGHKKVCGK